MMEKNGFSVVAPMRRTRPFSTAGRRASCWALLKRWISSRKRIELWWLDWVRWTARARALRRSARLPSTPLTERNWEWVALAMMWARVVFPEPGGP